MRRLAAAFVRRGRAAAAGTGTGSGPGPGVAARGRRLPPVLVRARPLWAAMPGRNKAAGGGGCPEVLGGQQAAEAGRDAAGRSPHGDEEEERGANLGDPDIVKSPSDPKQYR